MFQLANMVRPFKYSNSKLIHMVDPGLIFQLHMVSFVPDIPPKLKYLNLKFRTNECLLLSPLSPIGQTVFDGVFQRILTSIVYRWINAIYLAK